MTITSILDRLLSHLARCNVVRPSRARARFAADPLSTIALEDTDGNTYAYVVSPTTLLHLLMPTEPSVQSLDTCGHRTTGVNGRPYRCTRARGHGGAHQEDMTTWYVVPR